MQCRTVQCNCKHPPPPPTAHPAPQEREELRRRAILEEEAAAARRARVTVTLDLLGRRVLVHDGATNAVSARRGAAPGALGLFVLHARSGGCCGCAPLPSQPGIHGVRWLVLLRCHTPLPA
jgi:hypothetical protein